jgi:tetratricopeptide (TPR) repeat protein
MVAHALSALCRWLLPSRFAQRIAQQWFALAQHAQAQNQLRDAVHCLRYGLRWQPRHAGALAHLGALLCHLEQTDEGITLLQRAFALRPHQIDACLNLGAACKRLRRFEEAALWYQRALDIRDHPEAHYQRGILCEFRCEWEKAMACHRRALRAAPDDPRPAYNLGILHLLHGDYAAGWTGYEARLHVLDSAGKPQFDIAQISARFATLLAPDRLMVWDGQPFAHRPLLLIAEQGRGDCLMMLRFLPWVLDRRGTPDTPVALFCDSSLNPLVHSNFPAVQTIETVNPDQIRRYAHYYPLMSLPFLMGLRLADLSEWSPPYLRVPHALGETWSLRLDAAWPHRRLRVGLVWAGNPELAADHKRSIGLQTFAPLLAMPDIDWISLQKDLPSGSADAPALRSMMDQCGNFLDTAALMVHLDLVISVDTAVAHLAGALGVPVWMLCRYESEWRWMLERSDSPWYPSMRIFRQSAPGDWNRVIAQLQGELGAWVRKSSGPGSRD